MNYITPDYVHVMMQGRIVKSGGPELAQRLKPKVTRSQRKSLGIVDKTLSKKRNVKDQNDNGNKLPFDTGYITSFSKKMGEPEWLTNLRTEALKKAEQLPLPKADKTDISNWNFSNFSKHLVESEDISSLDELAEEIKSLVNLQEEEQSLYIQRNNCPSILKVSKEMQDQGVIFMDIFTAAREHGDLLRKYFMKDGVKVDEHKLTALHAALMNGGVFYTFRKCQLAVPSKRFSFMTMWKRICSIMC